MTAPAAVALARVRQVPGRWGVPEPSRAFVSSYARVLRLRCVRLRWWLRSLYLEGAVVVGFVLYLANWASAWAMVALPAAIAVAVKLYDVVLVSIVPAPGPARPAAPAAGPPSPADRLVDAVPASTVRVADRMSRPSPLGRVVWRPTPSGRVAIAPKAGRPH